MSYDMYCLVIIASSEERLKEVTIEKIWPDCNSFAEISKKPLSVLCVFQLRDLIVALKFLKDVQEVALSSLS